MVCVYVYSACVWVCTHMCLGAWMHVGSHHADAWLKQAAQTDQHPQSTLLSNRLHQALTALASHEAEPHAE